MTAAVQEPIRTAIIGFGLAGSVFHGPLLAADPSYRIDAIVTADPGRAAAAAARYPGARILDKPARLWDSADRLDLVVIASPTPGHVALADAAIDAGVSLVIEKPLAVTRADGERLIDRAARAGVLLTVFQNRRWDGDFLTVQDLVGRGELGTVTRFESRFEWLNPRPRPAWKTETSGIEGGGVAYDLGAHLVDQALALFGPVAEVYGEFEMRRPGAVNDDDSFMALRHASGVTSHLWMSSLVAQRGPRFRVLGSGTAFVTWGLDPQEGQLASGMSASDPRFGGYEAEGRLGTDAEPVRVGIKPGQYREFYARLAAALRHGGPVPVDPREALEAIAIIESLHASSARV
jgi:scyllo-inositol 2-dehydrogenase (NADP+)